jgi:hypothetical protein
MRVRVIQIASRYKQITYLSQGFQLGLFLDKSQRISRIVMKAMPKAAPNKNQDRVMTLISRASLPDSTPLMTRYTAN